VSLDLMSAVWNTSKSTGNSRMLLLALADNANSEGYCWPSITTLQKKCAASRQTVLDCIDKLESIGELYVDRKQRRGNHYVVLVGLSDQSILKTLTEHIELTDEEAREALASIVENRNKSRNLTRQNKSRNLTKKVEKLDQSSLEIRPDPLLTITNRHIAPPENGGEGAADGSDTSKPEPPAPSDFFKVLQSELVTLAYDGNAAQYGSAGDLAHVLLGTAKKPHLAQFNLTPAITLLEFEGLKRWYAQRRDKRGRPLNWPKNVGALHQMVYDFRREQDYGWMIQPVPEPSTEPTGHEILMGLALAAGGDHE